MCDGKAVAVVKADAYGNGAVLVAKTLDNKVDLFAVAIVEEAIALREAGIQSPILVMQGPHQAAECALTVQYNLRWILHHQAQLDWLCTALDKQTLLQHAHWVKFDTGMHRLGFMPDQYQSLCQNYPDILHAKCVITTHLACADEPDNNSAEQQIAKFVKSFTQHQHFSIANSAASAYLTEAHQHWNRLGISLYGSSPFEQSDIQLELQAVMRLKAQVIALREVETGEAVGYGGTWCAQQKSLIATVGIGYADGYPRHAPNGTPAIIKGRTAFLAGRVSMDMLTFDVTHIPGVQLGDEVELWGDNLPINSIAKHVGTIGYELMTRVSSRVPRRYINP